MSKKNLDMMVETILNDRSKGYEDAFEAIADAFVKEVSSDDESPEDCGQAMLEAWLDKDVDAFCMAVCGWTFESILKRAHVIPDDDGTWNPCEQRTNLVGVKLLRAMENDPEFGFGDSDYDEDYDEDDDDDDYDDDYDDDEEDC